jgi:hypothetical protein
VELQKRREQVQHIHEKVLEARILAARRFEREHGTIIKDIQFTKGALVLARNTAIEKALNKKMKPRYVGPLVIITRNRGGAYVLCELNRSVLDRPVAVFRLVPYFAWTKVELPNDALDTEEERLHTLQNSKSQGDDDENDVEEGSDSSDKEGSSAEDND